MEITAAMVRELREKSGAGMMDCKKALTESGGDLEAAFDFLRKQGLKSAEKKASREMGEGRVFAKVADDGHSGALVAVSCETDFVAKTPDFEGFLERLTGHVLEHRPASVDELLGQSWGGGDVGGALKELVGKLGENISVVRVACYENAEGRVGAYIHHNDRVGVLVSVDTDKAAGEADETIKSLCLHVAAIKPEYLTREDVPAEVIEREKDIYRESVKDKPENIQDKILTGKLDKFFSERVLHEQPWVMDDKLTVRKAVAQALGDGANVRAFSRFEV